MKKITFLLIFISVCYLSNGQSLTHPHIWVKDAEKQIILDKISQNTWATNLLNQYKGRVDSKRDSHKINPSTIINTIPSLPGNRTTHRDILTLGFDASLLYWLTNNEDYGQLAADILYNYTKKIAQISGNVDFHSGDYLIDSREAYTKPPMIYDFVHGFLVKSGTTVYDIDTGTRVPFNFTNSETAFKKLADNVFNRGGLNSNHPVLEGPGALFNVLSIEDDATRQTYFNKFMNGATRQNGLTWMMNRCKDSGAWPEATGYSIGPQRIVLELMEVVDRYNPSLNIFNNYKAILEDSFFFENYRFPNSSEVMRFGDAHRTRLNTEDLMERVFVISKRKGYTNLELKAEEMLKAFYSAKGGFSPTVSTQTLEWNNPLNLLWISNIALINVTPINYSSSITIDYAGIAMQRNLNTNNRVESGLMGYTGGAHYVHSHLSGIDMEIYGLGAVMGTGGGDVGAGNNARDGDEFRNYHRIYAGHNTVIINGTSKGTGLGAWKADNQIKMDKTVTLAAEPVSLADPIASNFTFSAQVLDDGINNAKQQRVFSVIRTSDNTGYYFDLFRSKSLGTNNFHDYVYHNVGDNVSMVDASNNPISLTPQVNRYPSIESVYAGKSIFFPGWHYFEQVNTSAATTTSVKATIPMTKQGVRYMHMLMPGGESREYTACKGPATIEAQMGYDGIKTPIVTVRQPGEAWDRPFISIFEPSRNASGTVQSVENLYTGAKIVGAKVTSLVNGVIMTDYIISNENDGETYTSTNPNISFTGRFAIIRITPTTISQYIGQGQQLTYLGETLYGDNDGKAYLEYANGPQPFAVTLLSPFNNQEFLLNQEVQLYANATTDTGNITKVEFYINGTLYQEATTFPYLLNWTPTLVGNYTIKAKAYNSGGNSIESSEVTIVVNDVDKTDLTGDTYRLRNVATGKFLGTNSSGGQPVIMRDTAEDNDRHWEFVKVNVSGTEYFNIDSKLNGVLRGTGGAFGGGAYLIVSTGNQPTNSDVDKVWTVHYNQADDTYRFEVKDGGRFMYEDPNGNVYNYPVDETDTRSKWQAIPTSVTLSDQENELQELLIKVYPNPTSGVFEMIVPKHMSGIKLEVSNIHGQLISSKMYDINGGKVSLDISDRLPGLYFVKLDLEKPVYVKVMKN
ncbi:Ig-like domain-containing protein [Litoribaculum gwangyangense]|uniref:T9SS type A sorting domain-containing protein n=1 Tax=Litoribaculum gwangyangense TaxID=1130722 RepID=A0ABP9CP74_9FLAO